MRRGSQTSTFRTITSALAALSCSVLILPSLIGCSSTAKVEAHGTTVGRELQDLEDAREKGLVTEKEYNKQRDLIMKRK